MPVSIPLDDAAILTKYKALRRQLLASGEAMLEKRIAILGGSTTADVRKMLELFLLSHGIAPIFYESEYAQYWHDAMFGSPGLAEFRPDVIFIHTTNRNITRYPEAGDSEETVNALLAAEFDRFAQMWEKLTAAYGCPLIQNNFEYPYWRLMGNAEASLIQGRVNFITRLNLKFYEWAQAHSGFFVNDINWLAADYGLAAWFDPVYWHMYKYALAPAAIPRLAQSVANIIKSLYGKNKKALALDLDNTLWGGAIGDDGAEGIELGQETPLGQMFWEFQEYIKAHKKLGVVLNVISQNEPAAALAGLNHPDCLLSPADFVAIKANYEPKSDNLQTLAHELALLPESFVFVDDNPAERELVRQQIKGAAVPEIGDRPENYIKAIDRCGYFEVTSLTKDDANRSDMYKANLERGKAQIQYTDYDEYLRSLEMRAEILPFCALYAQRIAQLTNRSNQFNLTTLRCTQEEIERLATDSHYITLYGRLTDKFGDNGIVCAVIGEVEQPLLHIRLWLMSCRVLKRGLEYALMGELVKLAWERGITELRGYYRPTAKNGMVHDFYDKQGFTLASEDEGGGKTYALDISSGYERKQNAISVN
jgi:FkbH-like protein